MDELTNAYFNSAYDELYEKVLAYVVTKCNKLEYVEDIVQDTFGEFYSLLEKRGLKYIKNREALIFKIAKFKVYRYYTLKERLKRNISLTKEDGDGAEYDLAADTYEVEDRIINQCLIEDIWSIIMSMPVAVQKVFVLHYYFDKTIKEVAEILHLGESDVKHKLYRTIEKIRDIYKEGDIL